VTEAVSGRPKVLDASVILAAAFNEPGGKAAREQFAGAYVSTINWSEVLQKVAAKGGDAGTVSAEMLDLDVSVEPFVLDDAILAAALWPSTRHLGLSLGDRACLALGKRLSTRVLTMDTEWAKLPDQDVEVLSRLAEREPEEPGS